MLCVILSVVLIFTLTQTIVLPVSAAQSGDFTYTSLGNDATITKYTGTDKSISIPKIIDGYNVKSITGALFSATSVVESISIPDSVTAIDNYILFGCKTVKDFVVDSNNTVFASQDGVLFNKAISTLVAYPSGKAGAYYIPSSVDMIAREAFVNSTLLTRVSIPALVRSIMQTTFSGCTNLSDVDFHGNAPSLGSQVFSFCSPNLKVYYTRGNTGFSNIWNGIPAAIVDYSYGVAEGKAFITGYSGINEDLIIPATLGGYSVNTINSFAFADCLVMKTVSIEDGLSSISASAFSGCTNLTSVTFGVGLKTIGNNAFEKCSKLASITIPNSVDSLGDFVFSYCTELASVNIGTGISAIGIQAFRECSSLIQVTLPNNINAVNGYAFYNCSKLTTFSMGNNLVSIGEESFKNCAKLSGISFPSSLETISRNAFENCVGLITVTFPNNITNLEASSFTGCTGLQSVVMGSGITVIESGTFEDCTALTSISFGNKVNIIRDSAFSGCVNLAIVNIPASVVTIEYAAFYGDSNLMSVTFSGNAPEMQDEVFDGATAAFKVFYFEGKNGFTNPWHGYTTVMVTPTPVQVSSIKLNKTSITLKVTLTAQLISTLLPSNATNKTIKWSSSNPKIATVSALGKIIAKAPGIITITAASWDSLKKATCKVIVTQPVVSVKLNKASISILKGKTSKLIPTINPSNSSNKKVTWKSSNTAIATVSSTGAVKGIKKGSCYISVVTVDGKKSSKCKVIVK